MIAAAIGVVVLSLIIEIADAAEPLDIAFAASLASQALLLFMLDREQRAASA